MIGEDGSYFRKGDLFFFYVTAFLIRSLLRVPSYSVGGGGTGSYENYIYIMKRWLEAMLSGVADHKRMTRHSK